MHVMMQGWDADMDVKNEVEEDNLAEDFDRALNESMAAKDEDGDDREVRHLKLKSLLCWLGTEPFVGHTGAEQVGLGMCRSGTCPC